MRITEIERYFLHCEVYNTITSNFDFIELNTKITSLK